jgi:hypothetical protein
VGLQDAIMAKLHSPNSCSTIVAVIKKDGEVFKVLLVSCILILITAAVTGPLSAADNMGGMPTASALVVSGVGGPEGLVLSTTVSDFKRVVQIINTTNQAVSVKVELPELIGPDARPTHTSWTLDGKVSAQTEVKPLGSIPLELSGYFRAAGDYTSTISLVYGEHRYAFPLKITRSQAAPTVDVVGLDSALLAGSSGPFVLRFSLKENGGNVVQLRAPTISSLTRKVGDRNVQARYDSVTFSAIDSSTGKLLPAFNSLTIEPNASVPIAMTLVGLSEPGEYAGSLVFSSNSGSLPSKPFTLYLKRSVILAIVLITVGVLLSHGIRYWTKTGRPRLILMRQAVLVNEDLEKLRASLVDPVDQNLLAVFRGRLDRVRDDIVLGIAKDEEARLNDINSKLNLVPPWSDLRKRIGSVQPPEAGGAAQATVKEVEKFLSDDTISKDEQIKTESDKLTQAFKTIDEEVRTAIKKAIDETKHNAQTAKSGLAEKRQGDFDDHVILALANADTEISKTTPDSDSARRLLNSARLSYARIMADDLDEKLSAITQPDAIPQDQWNIRMDAFRTNAAKARSATEGDVAMAALESAYRVYLQLLVSVAKVTADNLNVKAKEDQHKQSLQSALDDLAKAQNEINSGRLEVAKQNYDSARTKIDVVVKALTPTATVMEGALGIERAPGEIAPQLTSLATASRLLLLPRIPIGLVYVRTAERYRGGWSTVKEIDQAITVRDRWVSVVIGIIAVALGIFLIWIDNLSWGTPKDMFVAVLWGLGLHQIAGNAVFAKLDLDQLVSQVTGAKPSGG